MKKITQLIVISLLFLFGTMNAQEASSFSDADLSTLLNASSSSSENVTSAVIPGQTRAVTASFTSRAAFQAA